VGLPTVATNIRGKDLRISGCIFKKKKNHLMLPATKVYTTKVPQLYFKFTIYFIYFCESPRTFNLLLLLSTTVYGGLAEIFISKCPIFCFLYNV